MSNVLELNDDELNLVVGTVWAKLSGLAKSRASLEKKLLDAFENAFGVEPNKIHPHSDGTVYVSSDSLQKNLDDFRTDKAKLTEGAQTFTYHGVERVVKVENIDSKKRLLSGVELLRDGKVSNQFKHFKLAEIG